MKNIEVLEIYNKLEKADLKGISGSKLNFAILTNKELLKTISTNMQASRVYAPEFEQYMIEAKKIFDKYADKDAAGNNVVYNETTYKISDLADLQKYKDEVLEFNVINVDTLAAAKLVDEEYVTFLEEECSIELKKIDITLIPESMTIEQLDALMFMVVNNE